MERGGDEPDTIHYHGKLDSKSAQLIWKIDSETPTEVHITVELNYSTSTGIINRLTESTIYKAYRLQSIRDSLWRLKQYLENFDNDRL